ncbi:MAG: tRNA pseudouridine(55) synthase TruB [bacterium]
MFTESGLLNVFKPVGMTSHDVVDCVRRGLGGSRVGHAGTLDPAACGVLLLLVNDATKLSKSFTDMEKGYRAEATLGVRTTTGDYDGDILESAQVDIERDALERASLQFCGTINQIPPMTSARKVKGQKLYKLARRGIEVERPSKVVTIHSFKILDVYFRGAFQRVLLDIECSSGTYIRTLVEDYGKALSVPACVSFLLRTRVGEYKLRDSVSLQKIMEHGAEAHIIKLKK